MSRQGAVAWVLVSEFQKHNSEAGDQDGDDNEQ